jgi:hypothetical protein
MFSAFFGEVPEISDKNCLHSLAETLSFGNFSKINFSGLHWALFFSNIQQ